MRAQIKNTLTAHIHRCRDAGIQIIPVLLRYLLRFVDLVKSTQAASTLTSVTDTQLKKCHRGIVKMSAALNDVFSDLICCYFLFFKTALSF